MLNKQKGNMYPWISHTWNPIKGNCPHKCSYCYMKKWGDLGEPRLVEKCLKDNLGSGNTIFVGSSIDMFAEEINSFWIKKVLSHCRKYKNNYLFQSKNPEGFSFFHFPENTILGTTLESDHYIYWNISDAPSLFDRYVGMRETPFPKMISIEPIMDFDIGTFIHHIRDIQPIFVSIGADSGGNDLPEPQAIKIKALISELKTFTEVKIKKNLSRLLK